MVPSSMDRDVMSDMSCRGCDMDNLDHAVGNASVGYRDEISVGNDGAGVDDGSWSLPTYFVASNNNEALKQKAQLFWRVGDRQADPLSSLLSSCISFLLFSDHKSQVREASGAADLP